MQKDTQTTQFEIHSQRKEEIQIIHDDWKDKKLSFFENLKFLYNYKITALIIGIWVVGYPMLAILWGVSNNHVSYLNKIIMDPMIYLLPVLSIVLVSVIQFGIDGIKDLCYGPTAGETWKIFKNKEFFDEWRKGLYKIINNKILLLLSFLASTALTGSGIFAIMILDGGDILPGANVFNSPILLVANIFSAVVGFLFWTAGFLGVFMIVIALNWFIKLGKDTEKLSIGDLLEKYQSRLKNKKEYFDTDMTYFEFQRLTRILGRFLFRLFFKLIILAIIVNVVGIIPLRLGIWTPLNMYTWIALAFLSILFFIIPQITVHITLKNAKEKIIETLDQLQDKTREKLGDDLYLKEDEITTEEIDRKVKILKHIQTSKEELKKLGTWAYDFPEVLKLLVVASLSIIPVLIEFLG